MTDDTPLPPAAPPGPALIDAASAMSPPTPAAPATPPVASAAAPAPRALTPEEQMEAFAQDLKENDWGHQPC